MLKDLINLKDWIKLKDLCNVAALSLIRMKVLSSLLTSFHDRPLGKVQLGFSTSLVTPKVDRHSTNLRIQTIGSTVPTSPCTVRVMLG